jgi:hypothetical protein
MNISLRKQAWRAMFYERTCPPPAILNDPQHVTRVEEHRKGCPLCAMKSSEIDSESWAELGRRLSESWPKPERPNIQVGQIWSLKPEKGGWTDSFRYCNPPLVLLIDVLDEVDGVRVAQVFDAPLLAHDGDIPLGDEHGLAQAWNTYALDQADLDLCFGEVDARVVDAVIKAAHAVGSDLDETSTIWFFRQLELEVGASMAMEALDRLMERHERNAIREIFANIKQTLSRILAFEPRIQIPSLEDSLLAVASAKFPCDADLLAAAGELQQVKFNSVVVEGETMPCAQAFATIKAARIDGGKIRVTGELPKEAREGVLFAWWRVGDLAKEGHAKFDPKTGDFRVEFPDQDEKDFADGQLMLLLVSMGNHESDE